MVVLIFANLPYDYKYSYFTNKFSRTHKPCKALGETLTPKPLHLIAKLPPHYLNIALLSSYHFRVPQKL